MVLTQKIFCLFSLGFVCFWLVSTANLEFFCIHTINQYLKKQKTQVFFGCVFFVMVWYGFKSQKKCFLFFAYMLSTNISKKRKNSRFFFFCCYGLIWFQKPKAKKNLSFCFLHTCYQRYLKKNSGVFCLFAFVVMVWYVMQYLIQRVPDTLRKKWGQWGML